MKSLNLPSSPSRIGIPALCANLLLFSFSTSASAYATLVATDASGVQGSHSNPQDSLDPAPVVIRSTGAIEGDLNLFRALLGGNNNLSLLGQQDGGRREVNWDGVPANFTNVPTFPVDFFNTNVTRGLVYDTTTFGLEVSNNSFTGINAAYDGEFVPFSGTKTFSSVGTNQTGFSFRVAGSNTKAKVSGIGIVFADVDKIGGTAIELLGDNGKKLGRFTVPIRSDRRGSSFLGIVFRDPVIRHVNVIAGDASLSSTEIDLSQGGQHDLVVMDDFIYGEPTATR